MKKIHSVIFYIIVFILFFSIQPGRAHKNPVFIYSARLQVYRENGQIINKKLILEDATDEFRYKNFKKVQSIGSATSAHDEKIDTAAVEDAIQKLLLTYGLKSINSRSSQSDQHYNDKIIMEYQGLIKLPFEILSQTYIKNTKKYTVEISLWFCPVAFPDTWRFYYLKHKAFETIQTIASWFYR